MTIRILHHTVNYQKRVVEQTAQGTDTSYVTVPGELTQGTGPSGVTYGDMLAGMLEAQNVYGQITWFALGDNIAKGSRYNNDHAGHDRIVVIDTENADGSDILDAVVWVHDASDRP